MFNMGKIIFLISLLSLPTVSLTENFTEGNITRLELAMLQYLSRSDLEISMNIDGQWGPKSRKALAEFARRNELPENAEAMMRELKKRNTEQRIIISKIEFLEYIREGVSYNLLDPFSSKLRNVYWSDRNICGEINAKNAYGAYTGFKLFKLDSMIFSDISWDLFNNQISKLKNEKPPYSDSDLKERLHNYIVERGQSDFVIDDPDKSLYSRVYNLSPCLVTLVQDRNFRFSKKDYEKINELFVD